MNEHTQGEWFAKRDGWSTVYVECRIGGGMLQEVSACGPTANGSGEQEANARLIAAAPHLLTTAYLVMGWWDAHQYDTHSCGDDERNTYDDEPEFVVAARAAIARATGEQK